MTGGVSVIIPWRSGCPHRERALSWVRDRWLRWFAGMQIVVGAHNDGPWCKALAVANGLDLATGDTLIIADADVFPADHRSVLDGLLALEEYGWAVPHLMLHRLTERATAALLDGAAGPGEERAEDPYVGWLGGGITILDRATYEQVPLDHRFEGWGQEDEAWATALGTLAGPAWRGEADLWHLWHPTQPRRSRSFGSHPSKDLRDIYRAASGQPIAMHEIVAAGRLP